MKILLLLNLLILSSLHAENVRDHDIEKRQQGATPFCFAFGEEQVLKDEACAGKACAVNNASTWMYSIFDIVKQHREYYKKTHPGSGIGDVDMFFTGGDIGFNFLENKTSLLASKCTFERELMLLSFDPGFNSKHVDLGTLLRDHYPYFSKNNATISVQKAPDGLDLEGAVVKLNELGKVSTSADDFVMRVVNYHRCETQIPLPKRHVHSVQAVDVVSMNSKIDLLVLTGHSVAVGLCSADLHESLYGESSCGPHVVTIKGVDPFFNQYRVVDSAFHSNRPRMSDGSIMIPKAVILRAMANYINNISMASRMGFDMVMQQMDDGTIDNLFAQRSRDPSARSVFGFDQAARSFIDPMLRWGQFSDLDRKALQAEFAALKTRNPSLFEARSFMLEIIGKATNAMNIRYWLGQSLASGGGLDDILDYHYLQKPNISWLER